MVAPVKKFFRRARIALIAVLAVVLVGAGLFVGMRFSGILTDAGTKITGTTIKNSFSDIAELASEQYNFTAVGKFADGGKKLFGMGVPLTGKSFLITYKGVVKAGLKDISKIKVDTDGIGKKITITAPPCTVLSAKIDPESIEQYDQTFNPINQLQVSDVAKFTATEERRNSDEAVKSGLLERAQKRTETLLSSHVKSLIANTAWKDFTVKVEFEK